MFTGQFERWREVYEPNPAMLRLLLFQEGYDIYQWVERPGSLYNWHFHEEEQIHWVISGEVEVTVQDFGREFSYTLKNGDRDYIPPRIYHRFRVIGETPLFYLNGIKRKIEEVVEIEETVEVVETKAKVRKTKAKVAKTKTAKPKTASTKRKKK